MTTPKESGAQQAADIAAEGTQLQAGAQTGSGSSTGTDTGTPTTASDGSIISPEDQALIDSILGGGGSGGTKKVDPDVSRGTSVYVSIWGQDPPKGYIEQLVKAGMNANEIAAHELSKTDSKGRILAKNTHYWRDRSASYAAALSQLMGRR